MENNLFKFSLVVSRVLLDVSMLPPRASACSHVVLLYTAEIYNNTTTKFDYSRYIVLALQRKDLTGTEITLQRP